MKDDLAKQSERFDMLMKSKQNVHDSHIDQSGRKHQSKESIEEQLPFQNKQITKKIQDSGNKYKESSSESSGEDLMISQTHGYEMTVNTTQLDEFDYIESINQSDM